MRKTLAKLRLLDPMTCFTTVASFFSLAPFLSPLFPSLRQSPVLSWLCAAAVPITILLFSLQLSRLRCRHRALQELVDRQKPLTLRLLLVHDHLCELSRCRQISFRPSRLRAESALFTYRVRPKSGDTAHSDLLFDFTFQLKPVRRQRLEEFDILLLQDRGNRLKTLSYQLDDGPLVQATASPIRYDAAPSLGFHGLLKLHLSLCITPRRPHQLRISFSLPAAYSNTLPESIELFPANYVKALDRLQFQFRFEGQPPESLPLGEVPYESRGGLYQEHSILQNSTMGRYETADFPCSERAVYLVDLQPPCHGENSAAPGESFKNYT